MLYGPGLGLSLVFGEVFRWALPLAAAGAVALYLWFARD